MRDAVNAAYDFASDFVKRCRDLSNYRHEQFYKPPDEDLASYLRRKQGVAELLQEEGAELIEMLGSHFRGLFEPFDQLWVEVEHHLSPSEEGFVRAEGEIVHGPIARLPNWAIQFASAIANPKSMGVGSEPYILVQKLRDTCPVDVGDCDKLAFRLRQEKSLLLSSIRLREATTVRTGNKGGRKKGNVRLSKHEEECLKMKQDGKGYADIDDVMVRRGAVRGVGKSAVKWKLGDAQRVVRAAKRRGDFVTKQKCDEGV